MFLVMMILFFIAVRAATGGRRARCVPLHYRATWQPRPQRVRMPPSQPNAFERLKQRYVAGDLSDEQYEAEVDRLLRTPETRTLVP